MGENGVRLVHSVRLCFQRENLGNVERKGSMNGKPGTDTKFPGFIQAFWRL